MIVSKDNFPVVLQAYEIQNNKEVFLAEQVVNNQGEVDTFTTRFTGKLIKAKQFTDGVKKTGTNTNYKKSKVSVPVIILIILIILVGLIVVGFSTGWIQENLGISI
jgi:hypothetical protein